MGAQKLSKGRFEYTERIFIIVVAYSRGKVQWRNFYPRSTGAARLQKSAFAKMRGRIVEVPGGAQCTLVTSLGRSRLLLGPA